MKDFKKLKVWQIGIEIVTGIYKISSSFPKDEIYGLIGPISRSSIYNQVFQKLLIGPANKLLAACG